MVLDIHIQKDEIRTLSNTIHKNQLKIKKVKCEPSYTVDGDVNWYSHYGEQYGDSLKKQKIELPYDPVIPLLGIYTEKTIIQKVTYIPMFTATLFTITIYYLQDMEATF